MQTENTNPDKREMEIRKKAVRLGENLWGSYVYLSPIAKEGDYILPISLTQISENTYVLKFRHIKVEETKEVNKNE